MPLEFIHWSIFHFHIQFRPWQWLRAYVTWDGLNPVAIWDPPENPTVSHSREGVSSGYIFWLLL